MHLYATAGRGFETPTLNELAYRPERRDRAQFRARHPRRATASRSASRRAPAGATSNLAVFDTRTENEIATLSNVGGRATFQNVGRTRRQGLEVAWYGELRNNLRGQAALTLLDARYRDTFNTCTATPCPAPTLTVPARQQHPRSRDLCLLRRGRVGAAARLARRRRSARAQPGLGQRRQLRQGSRLRDPQRQRRLPRPRRPRRMVGVRAHRQHLRSPLRRLGDRQRGQRPLLRARAGTQLDRRTRGDCLVLTAAGGATPCSSSGPTRRVNACRSPR